MKMFKPFWMLLMLLAIPAPGHAQFTFLTNNSVITITAYTGTNSDVVIPAATNGYPVTSIGNSAFYNCSAVTNVIIPISVTNIDVQAFCSSGLIGVTIPDSVRTIGQAAFQSCYSLVYVSIGTNVSKIDYDAFDSCISLTNVFIPKGVTNLLPAAFAFCSHLTNLTVDSFNPAYSSLDGVIFDKNQTKLICFPDGLTGTYSIPGTVTNVADYAFLDAAITNVVIPGSVANIGQFAFSGVTLSNLTLPNGVVSIGRSAFYSTVITNVFIPASLTNIGAYALAFPSLRGFTVDTNNPAYRGIDGVLYSAAGTTLVAFPIGKSGTSFKPGSYTITNGVTCIADAAFAYCLLSNVTIATSVTSIGSDAFKDCSHLANITIPYGVTNIGNTALEGTSLSNLIVPASVTTFGYLGSFAHLQSIYFEGNLPGAVGGIPPIEFIGRPPIAIYYLPGATGWGSTYSDYSTFLWLPQMQTTGPNFGIHTNRFGFNINWASGHPVAIDVCTNLSNPVWQPMQTNALASGSFYFTDPQWTNSPGRFYRLRAP